MDKSLFHLEDCSEHVAPRASPGTNATLYVCIPDVAVTHVVAAWDTQGRAPSDSMMSVLGTVMAGDREKPFFSIFFHSKLRILFKNQNALLPTIAVSSGPMRAFGRWH